MIITGTGRASTTLLAQVLTDLGLDTGYTSGGALPGSHRSSGPLATGAPIREVRAAGSPQAVSIRRMAVVVWFIVHVPDLRIAGRRVGLGRRQPSGPTPTIDPLSSVHLSSGGP